MTRSSQLGCWNRGSECLSRMTFVLRRLTALKSLANSHGVSRACCKFYSEASNSSHAEVKHVVCSPSVSYRKRNFLINHMNRLHLSPLFLEAKKHCVKNYKIGIIDDETWQMSSGLAEAWKGNAGVGFEGKILHIDKDQEIDEAPYKECPDFDEIEDMRVCNDLFYKLDKGSKEYEEYKFDFHGRKSSKNWNFHEEKAKIVEKKLCVASQVEMDLRSKVVKKEIKKSSSNSDVAAERFHRPENEDLDYRTHNADLVGKKLRILTFNQLTAPYHEPFCLDIYVSKGSARASIIHRATSKVIVVAHSISKDLKFDLGSTKSRSACTAVGEVLARRALADDIHNVVYTPRRGERLVGKLQVVLQSIIDHGIDVKVKVKQKKMKRCNTKT